MGHYKEGFVSDYVSAIDLPIGQEVTVKIARIEKAQVEDRNGKKKPRWVLHFDGAAKPMLLIRTNAEALVAMFGPETNDWIGKAVTFARVNIRMYNEDTEQMEDTPAIRIVGSPELSAPKTFTLKLPRKAKQKVTLRPTGPQRRPAQQPAGERSPGQEG